jgi:quinol monooxygenase YgiN
VIVEYIRYRLPEGAAAAFVAAYANAAKVLDDSPHCLAYELSRCVDEPAVFMLRIEWDSASGPMDGFRKSPGFRDFFGAIRPYVANIEEMRHYEATAVRSRPSA